MSVKSSTFGGVYLTGVEAAKFRRQVFYGRPKKAASESLKKGRILLEEFNDKGYVTLYPISNQLSKK